MKAIHKLISKYAGQAICLNKSIEASNKGDELWNQLLEMLKIKNGFFAFESALHVFPLSDNYNGIEIVQWNRYDVWKISYPGENLRESICFASNAFGDQFCITINGVSRIDAETGEYEHIATDLNGWAIAIINDPDYHLGFQIAHTWQRQNGAISPGMRLVPKVPFICGGNFEVSNLHLMDTLKSLQVRGQLATQIHDIPDGETIEFEIQ